MSLKKTTRGENNTVTFDLLIENDIFEEAVVKVFKKKASKINVPGFRKGKAPRGIIEKMYGKGIFYEDALNDLLPGFLAETVENSGFDIVSRPEIEVGDINEEGVSITAKYFVKPEVKISDYVGIKLTREEKAVSDAEVDEQIEAARKRNARTIEITDRAVINDDTVIIDFEGSIDSVPFDGGKGTDHRLKIGSGQFIPGFEDQIIGHKIGEEFDVNVKFPSAYYEESLRDKNAVFKVKLNGIEVDELLPLDDEFAKDVSEFNTLEEYKADIKAKLTERNVKEADRVLEEALTDELLSKMEADIPACMIDDETENALREYEYNMSQQGINLEMYMKYTGMSLDAMKEQLRPNSERRVKIRLALEKIAALENIAPSKEDIEAEYVKVAEMYKIDADKARELISENMLIADLTITKALDFVKEKAVITKKTAKAVAKKTTKKAESDTADKTEKPANASKTTKSSSAAKTTKSAAAKTTKSTEAKKPAAKTTKTTKSTAKKTESEQ